MLKFLKATSFAECDRLHVNEEGLKLMSVNEQMQYWEDNFWKDTKYLEVVIPQDR